MPPLSDPSSSYSSDDSIHEELQSLRRTSTSQGVTSRLRKSSSDNRNYKKSHSTNSSPLRNKLFDNLPPHRSYETSSEESSVISYRDYSQRDEEGESDGGSISVVIEEDGGAAVTMNKPGAPGNDPANHDLPFDPLQESDTEEALAKSTTQFSNSKPKKHFKISKTVRFRDWENPIDPAKRSVKPKKKSRLFHRSKSILKTPENKLNSRKEENERAPSSDYTTTPDITAAEDMPATKPPTISDKQQSYDTILPEIIEPFTAMPDPQPPTRSNSKVKLVQSPIFNISSGNSQFSNQTSLFSKQDEDTAVSSEKSHSGQQLEEISYASSANSYENFGRATRKVKGPEEKGEDVISLSLARRFKKLSIKMPESKEINRRTAAVSSEPAASLKGFSLKLKDEKDEPSKPPSNKPTPEVSFDQIDILDQNPPELPEITGNIFPEPTQASESAIPLFDSFIQPGMGNANIELEKLKEENEVFRGHFESSLKKILFKILKFNDKNSSLNLLAVNLLDIPELLNHIEESVDFSAKTYQSLNIQQTKMSKQLSNQEDSIQYKESENRKLRKQISDLQSEMELRSNTISLLETRLDSQKETMSYEKDLRASLEKHISIIKSKLDRLTISVEEKDMLLKECGRLVNRHMKLFGDRVLPADHSSLQTGDTFRSDRDLINVDYYNSDLPSQLKLVLETAVAQLEKLDALKESNAELEEELSNLRDRFTSEKEDNSRLQELNKSKELELQALKKMRLELDHELEEANLQLERHKELIKSLERTDDEIKSALQQSALNLQEAESKNQFLLKEKSDQETKISEMEELLKEQIKVVEEANTHIESQSDELSSLQESLAKVNVKYSDLIKVKERLQTTVDYLSQQVGQQTEQARDFKLNEEKTTKQLKQSMKTKDEEVRGLRQKLKELEESRESLTFEVRETRNNLSEKATHVADVEKKVENISKSLQESHESNRSLRSDILRNGLIKQDLKRTLIGICVSLVKELEGIIDQVSLNTVKEGLQSDVITFDNDEEKLITNLKDASLFIEEAIQLVVKEYWSLSKRVSETHKNTLSNSSLGALQRINEIQLGKIKKFESKVQFYEAVFKKINNVNERPSTTHTLSMRSKSQQNHSPVQRKVQLAPPSQANSSTESPSDTESVKSTATALREKQQKINRLLSKVEKADRYNLDY